MNRNLQSKLAGLGAAALAIPLVLASGTAQAEVSSTLTIASDYDFRGITQNALDPAFQGSLDVRESHRRQPGARWKRRVPGSDACVRW